MAVNKLPSIPEPPKSADPALRAFLVSLKSTLETRLGLRGDPLDEMLTKRDLVDAGIAKLSNNTGSGLSPVVVPDSGSRIVPPAPVGFKAEGAFGGIQMTWENPFEAYTVHAYTEIWRGETNDREQAIFLDSSRGTVYFDRILDYDDSEYFYWIRYVSEYDKYGPWSLPFEAKKLRDMQEVLDEINGKIDESALTAAFQEKVADLSSSYVVKLDPTGVYAAGFGLYNEGARADFAVLADRFYVGKPGAGKVRPFVVQDGITYIDTAMIKEASIQQGQIGAISFGKITDSNGQSVTTATGLLRADRIDVQNLNINFAQVQGNLQSGALASNGQPRWILDRSGGLTLNGSSNTGRMEIRDTVIKVFDKNGVVRVQIGDLTL